MGKCMNWCLLVCVPALGLRCKRTFRLGHCEEIPGEERYGSEFRVQAPAEGCAIQVSVDGEEYEPVNMQVRLKPRYITMFT